MSHLPSQRMDQAAIYTVKKQEAGRQLMLNLIASKHFLLEAISDHLLQSLRFLSTALLTLSRLTSFFIVPGKVVIWRPI